MKTRPSLDQGRLRRRMGLPQQTGQRSLSRHTHGDWSYTHFPLFTGYERINSTSYTVRGPKLTVRPWTLLYAVSFNFVFTYTFSGTPEAFTIKLTLGDETQEIVTDTNATYTNVTTNINDLTLPMYKCLEATDMYFEIKVSSNVNPVNLYGVWVEVAEYSKDSYGDYRSPIYPLYDEHLVDYSKSELAVQEKRMDEESYLSGLAKS